MLSEIGSMFIEILKRGLKERDDESTMEPRTLSGPKIFRTTLVSIRFRTPKKVIEGRMFYQMILLRFSRKFSNFNMFSTQPKMLRIILPKVYGLDHLMLR